MAKKQANHAVQAGQSAARVSITFNGEKYENIVFTFNDLAEAEKELGINLLFGNASVLSVPSFLTVRTLLYVVLKRAGSKLTPTQIGEQIRLEDVPDLWAGLVSAFRQSGMQSKNPPLAPAKPGPSGTGESSGPQPVSI
jgi:hypothetical protein